MSFSQNKDDVFTNISYLSGSNSTSMIWLLFESDTLQSVLCEQSAYRPFHSMEAAVVPVHDSLIQVEAFDEVPLLVLNLKFSLWYGRSYQSFLFYMTSFPSKRRHSSGLLVRSTALVSWQQPFPLNAASSRGSSITAYAQDIVESWQVTALHEWHPTLCLLQTPRRFRSSSAIQLQLNIDESEITSFGLHPSLCKIACRNQTLTMGFDVIRSVEVINKLCVWIYFELTLKQHVSVVARVYTIYG